ncbi:MAG: choice-of-anchor V domain-containing protein [Polaribacter sp.]|uniref:choice-of-anchor V domain-containing protein n=1 Tax=Polaribacter sp. TaxID=1920175 RepID=UPI002F35BB88
MKKNYFFKFLLFMIPVAALTLLSFSNGNGSALSGSPGDGGNNCTQCHSGTANNNNISITTNIPSTGYAFNTEYDISITNSGGGSRNGFQVTAESDANNARIGTFSSSSSDTKTAASNTRIIHTNSGNSQNTWSFKWTSPSSEQGKITFYGSSVSGNGNGDTSGDQVFLGKSSSTSSLGISEAKRLDFDMYPNPATERLTIQLPSNTDKAEVKFYNYIGKLALSKTISLDDNKINVKDLSAGVYILKVLTEDKIGTQKFIKE